MLFRDMTRKGDIYVTGSNLDDCSIRVGKSCEIGPSVEIVGHVTIGDFCKIEDDTKLDRCEIGSNVYIGPDCSIESYSSIERRSWIMAETQVGRHVKLPQVNITQAIDIQHGHIIPLPVYDIRGYTAVAIHDHGKIWILGGCRQLTLDDARIHWDPTEYDGYSALAEQMQRALDFVESLPIPFYGGE